MNRAGIARLATIAEKACDPSRRPLSTAQRLKLLAELYAKPREDDLFADQVHKVEPPLDPERA